MGRGKNSNPEEREGGGEGLSPPLSLTGGKKVKKPCLSKATKDVQRETALFPFSVGREGKRGTCFSFFWGGKGDPEKSAKVNGNSQLDEKGGSMVLLWKKGGEGVRTFPPPIRIMNKKKGKTFSTYEC